MVDPLSGTGRTFSTGRAAKLCSVTRDTILKWIKKGILQAVRTPGGHYRVFEESLKPFLGEQGCPEYLSARALPASERRVQSVERDSPPGPIPCWEFNARNGIPAPACLDCLVYRSKAMHCFELAQVGEDRGFRGAFCKTSCRDCEYYRMVHRGGRLHDILVVTEDIRLIAGLTKGLFRTPFRIRFTGSSYECSMLIEFFKPGIILVDFDLHQVHMENLCQRLAEDDRLPGARIVAVMSRTASPEQLKMCSHAVCAVLEKPLFLNDLESCIEALEKKEDSRNGGD